MTINEIKTGPTFGEVKVGEVFSDDTYIYLKTDKVGVGDSAKNAVELKTGFHAFFYDSIHVRVMDAELTVSERK